MRITAYPFYTTVWFASLDRGRFGGLAVLCPRGYRQAVSGAFRWSSPCAQRSLACLEFWKVLFSEFQRCSLAAPHVNRLHIAQLNSANLSRDGLGQLRKLNESNSLVRSEYAPDVLENGNGCFPGCTRPGLSVRSRLPPIQAFVRSANSECSGLADQLIVGLAQTIDQVADARATYQLLK